MRATVRLEDRECPTSGARPWMAGASTFIALAWVLGGSGSASADRAPGSGVWERAPLAQYRMASPSEEIALARSAAPASVSRDADILVLGERGYETAVKGGNGFVCLVERSWFAPFGDPEFWNPHIRGPDCLNAAAARSVLPLDLERTQWVLAGLSISQMRERSKASSSAHRAPAPGALGYMMSKRQILGEAGHWHPHLMFFQAHTDPQAWGANLPGSPIIGAKSDPDEGTVFIVPVGQWSDGSAAPPMN